MCDIAQSPVRDVSGSLDSFAMRMQRSSNQSFNGSIRSKIYVRTAVLNALHSHTCTCSSDAYSSGRGVAAFKSFRKAHQNFRQHPHAPAVPKLRHDTIVSLAQPLTTGTILKLSTHELRWGSFVSKAFSVNAAVEECVEHVLDAIGQDATPELALVFVSSTHSPEFDQIVPHLRQRVPSLKHVFGCSSYGVVGCSNEGNVQVEGGPALSLTLGQLPGTDIRVMHTLRSSIPGPEATPEDWAAFVGVPHDTQRHVSFLVLADPRFAQVDDMLKGLDYAFPDAPKLGGVLSSGSRSKSRAMFAWSAGPDDDQQQQDPAALSREVQAAQGGSSHCDSDTHAAQAPSAMEGSCAHSGSGDLSVSARSSSGNGLGAEGSAAAFSAEAAAAAAAAAPTSSPGRGGVSGMWGRLVSRLSGVAAGTSNNSRGATTSQGSSNGYAAPAASSSSSEVDDGGDDDSRGVHMYGAVCCVLHGDVVIEPLVSQGYRAPSPRLWRVEGVTNRGELVALVPEEAFGDSPPAAGGPLAPVTGAPGGGGSGSGAARRGPALDGFTTGGSGLRSRLAAGIANTASSGSGSAAWPPSMGRAGSDADAGADDADAYGSSGEDAAGVGAGGYGAGPAGGGGGGHGHGGGGPVLPATAAVVDMLDALGDESADTWEELLDGAMLGVVSDNSKRASELEASDFELVPVEEVVEEYGMVVAEGDLRRGHRLCVMVRDERGMKEDLRHCLLAHKRKDLQAMVSGRELPPTFGVLAFTDMERGGVRLGEEGYEARQLGSYLPVPTAGMMGAAQIGRCGPSTTGTLEYACCVGVLRAAAQLRSPAAVRRAAAAAAQEAFKQRQQREAGQQQQQGDHNHGEGDGRRGL